MQLKDFDVYTRTILQRFRQINGCTYKFNKTFEGLEIIAVMPVGANRRFKGSRWSECAFKMNAPIKLIQPNHKGRWF